MKLIRLDGRTIKLDDEDLDKVKSIVWRLLKQNGKTNLVGCYNDEYGDYKTVTLTKFITGNKQSIYINGDNCDNQKANIGRRETSKSYGHVSKYYGVTVANSNSWVAVVSLNGITYNIGSYPDEIMAAEAVDYAKKTLKKDEKHIRSLNFPDKTEHDQSITSYVDRRIHEVETNKRSLKTKNKYIGVARTANKDTILSYFAKITIKGSPMHLGMYSDEDTAALAFDYAALNYRDRNTKKLNLPDRHDEISGIITNQVDHLLQNKQHLKKIE